MGSPEKNGGFTTADRPVRPGVSDPIYGYQRVNVAAQRRDPNSLLNWTERTIRMRKECPELAWGDWTILPTEAAEVLVMRHDWADQTIVTVHNFSPEPRAITLEKRAVGNEMLANLLTYEEVRCVKRGRMQIELEAYGYRWYRAGGVEPRRRR